jgi:hypothetical protein
VSFAHVVVNAGAALAALSAAHADSPVARMLEEPGPGLVLTALALCCARLALLTLDAREPAL